MQGIKVLLALKFEHFETLTIWTSKVPLSHLFIMYLKEVSIDTSHHHQSKRGLTFEIKTKSILAKILKQV